MKPIRTLFLLLCAFALPSIAAAQDDVLSQQVIKILDQGRDAWNNHDAETLNSLVDEAVIYVDSSNNQFQGREAYVAVHKKVFEDAAFSKTKSTTAVTDLHVFPGGEGGVSMATASLHWQLSGILDANGQPAPDRVGHSEVIFKTSKAGEWKLVAHRTYRQEADRESAIKALFDERQKGWNAKDADLLLNSMAENVYYESSGGDLLNGKDQVLAKYTDLFAGPMKQSKHVETIKSLHFVQDDLAIIEGVWENQTGEVEKSGKAIVLVRKFSEKDWKIISVQPER